MCSRVTRGKICKLVSLVIQVALIINAPRFLVSIDLFVIVDGVYTDNRAFRRTHPPRGTFYYFSRLYNSVSRQRIYPRGAGGCNGRGKHGSPLLPCTRPGITRFIFFIRHPGSRTRGWRGWLEERKGIVAHATFRRAVAVRRNDGAGLRRRVPMSLELAFVLLNLSSRRV